MTDLFLIALAVTGLVMKLIAQLLPATSGLDRRHVFWLLLSPTSHVRLQPIVNVRLLLFRPALLCGALLVCYCLYGQLIAAVGTQSILLSYCAAPVLLLVSETLLAMVTLLWLPSGHVLPSIHNRPWLARSVADFWSHRWNLWFSDWFRYAIFQRLRRRPVFALVLAFAVSGVLHEWVINVPLYFVTGRLLFGTMMLYFLLQAVGVLVERQFKGRPILLTAFAWFVVFAPAPLVLNEGLLRTMHLWPEPMNILEASSRTMPSTGAADNVSTEIEVNRSRPVTLDVRRDESTMKPYKKVDVSEAALDELVRRGASLIEDGLVYVDHQKPAAGGRLDVLLVDSGKSLVMAELKVVQEDGMLLQGVDYYDYVSSHVEAFARLYKSHGIDPTQQVRLFLIAPSFSQTLVSRCKWIDLPISLFTFHCLKFEDDDDLIPIFAEQPIPTQPEVVEIRHLDDHLGYITDLSVRSEVSALLDEIKNWKPANISLDPIKDAVSMKVNNRVFAYFYPRRKHYLLATYDAQEEWTEYSIKDDDDLGKVKPIMRAAVDRRVK